MNADTRPPEEPLFFHVVHPNRIQPGDVLYEINDRPIRGGAMVLRQARLAAGGPHIRSAETWELLPEKRSRSVRLVAADARLKVGRAVPVRRINPMVAAAAASLRKSKSHKRQPARDQLSLFDLPEGTRP